MWTIIALLLIFWLGGLLTSFTFGGWIHAAPLLAIVIVVLAIWSRGRRKRSLY